MVHSTASNYFVFGKGHIQRAQWRRYWKLLRLADTAYDARIAPALRRASREAARMPPQSILIAATEVPGREGDLAQVVSRIAGSTHHNVTVAITPMAPVGKFDNINRAISRQDLSDYDWLLIVDDDVILPEKFLDLLIYFSHRFNLTLAQPAHRFLSYASFVVTERHWASVARKTAFVEIGPISLIHKKAFGDLIPFPSLRWGWGLDMYWADIAKKRGWSIGIIDAVPIRHWRPIGASYSGKDAQEEAIKFLTAQDVRISRDDMLGSSIRLA